MVLDVIMVHGCWDSYILPQSVPYESSSVIILELTATDPEKLFKLMDGLDDNGIIASNYPECYYFKAEVNFSPKATN